MAVKIGHASTGERGGRGNEAGDQTGKEVKISNWYSSPWNVILRAKSVTLANKLAEVCEAGCNNNKIGYDMNDRNSAHTEAQKVGYDLSKITVPCETDCSAFMTLCAIASGVTELEYSGNAPVCSTMPKVFPKSRFHTITDKNILRSAKYLQRGDILINTTAHTAMVLSNGDLFYETFKGCKGVYVTLLQTRLASLGYSVGALDGDFGTKTEIALKNFQHDNNLTVDGICGKMTWRALGCQM